MTATHANQKAKKPRDSDRSEEADTASPTSDAPPSGAIGLGDAILQAKLTVGPASDRFELEADAVADRVVRALGTGVAGASAGDAPATVARRVQRAPVTVGLEGGELDDDTNRAIQSRRGGGKAMPSPVRESMEGAFGADFGAVRIHEGSQASELNDRIQAKAFTVGRDVFFRDGLPDTSTASGQHLLAHELTHTIQQGGAAVARSTRTSAAPASEVKRAPAAVQRLATGVVPFGAFTYQATASAVQKSKKSKLIPQGSKVTVDDAAILGSDENPKSRWAKVTTIDVPPGQAVTDAPASAPQKKSFWRGKKKPEASTDPIVPSANGWFPLQAISSGGGDGDDGFETADEVISPLGMMGDVADDLGSDGDDLLTGNQENNLNIASGAGGAASGLIGLAASIQKWREAETNEDRFEALLDTVDSAGGTAAGIAGMVKAGSDAQKGSSASDAAGGLGMFTSIFAGIKSTYELVKEAVNLAKDSQKMTKQEQLESSMAIIKNLLEAAASGVSAAKTFLDAFGAGANEALKNTVPGFGIAIGTVDIIVRAVALVKGLVQKTEMRKDKRSKKQDLEITLPDGRVVKGQTGKKFEAATVYKKLTKKAENDESSLTDPERQFLADCDANEQFQQYLFSKGLQYINQKRANRAILKMSVAMTQIAGDVATLGGASAPVGVGLKAGAMALDVGSSIFRKQKQYFRDMRAKKEKAGTFSAESNWFLNMYDSKKSSAAKLKTYNKMVDRIFDMIVTASLIAAPPPPAKDTRFVAVTKYLDAVGISMMRVKSFENDPAGLRKELIEYLQKRE